MDKTQLQECINECETALTHLNQAMSKMGTETSKQRLQHATKDVEECIRECRNMV